MIPQKWVFLKLSSLQKPQQLGTSAPFSMGSQDLGGSMRSLKPVGDFFPFLFFENFEISLYFKKKIKVFNFHIKIICLSFFQLFLMLNDNTRIKVPSCKFIPLKLYI